MRAVVLLLFLVSACVSSRGTVPLPPRDEDLVNGGTEEEQRGLMNRYEVTLGPRNAFIGESVRPRSDGLTGSLHPDVKAYLAADPRAVEALPSEWMLLLNRNLFYMAPLLMSTDAAVLGTVAALGVATGASAWILAKPHVDAESPGQSWILMFAVALSSLVPFLLAIPLLVPPTSGLVALLVLGSAADRRNDEAVAVFNQDLRQRIRGAARPGPSHP